jgi:hypothetical protein
VSTAKSPGAGGAGAGAALVQADTETLPQVAAQWVASLPAIPAAPQVPAYADAASSAVASTMADWPSIQAARTAQRQTAADEFVAAVERTSMAFGATDNGGASTISSAVGPTLI